LIITQLPLLPQPNTHLRPMQAYGFCIVVTLLHFANSFTFLSSSIPVKSKSPQLPSSLSAMPRVVVTGMGITSCLGNTLEEVTASLKECKSGIKHSPKYEELGIKSQVCGRPNLTEADFKEVRM